MITLMNVKLIAECPEIEGRDDEFYSNLAETIYESISKIVANWSEQSELINGTTFRLES